MKTFLSLSLVALCVLSACTSSPKTEARLGQWQVMTLAPTSRDGLCYAGTTPVRSSMTLENRTHPYLMVTRRPSGKIEVSASAGAPFAASSVVKLRIDDKFYRLFFKQDVAWAKDDTMDNTILAALKKAKTAELVSAILPNKTVTDTYSTDGFNDALKQLRVLCP